MLAPRETLRKAPRNRPLLAGLMLALFVFLLALAQFRTLHQLCHPEAGRSDHQCVVTMLATGQVDAPATLTALPPAPQVFRQPSLATPDLVSSADRTLLPSRGPPAPFV